MRWHLVLIGVGALICGGFAAPAIASLVPPERVASASAPVDELLTCAQVDEDMARLTAYRRSAITTRGIANSMAVSQGVAGVLMGEAMGMRFMQVQPGTPLHVATAGMREAHSYDDLIVAIEDRLIILLERKRATTCPTDVPRITRVTDEESLAQLEQLETQRRAGTMRDRAYQKERFKIFDSLRRVGVLPGTDAGGLRGSAESPQ